MIKLSGACIIMKKYNIIAFGLICIILLTGLITLLEIRLSENEIRDDNSTYDGGLEDGVYYITTRSRPSDVLLVVSTSPANDATNVPLNTTISVTFNRPIDVSSFSEAFMIDPHISGTFSWSNNNETVTFTPTYDFEDYTIYTVNLSAAHVKSETGDLTLDKDYSWSFEASHPEPSTFNLILGPFLNEDDKPVKGAKVTIIIIEKNYLGMTDASGMVILELPQQAPAGIYNVKVIKEDYEDLEYDLEIDSNGSYNPIPPETMDPYIPPPSFIPGFEVLILLLSIIPILIFLNAIKEK